MRARPGGEVQQPGAGPAAQIADQGTIKKELVQAKRRESEWQSRMAALEAEVKTVKAAREDDSAKFTELSEMLQVWYPVILKASHCEYPAIEWSSYLMLLCECCSPCTLIIMPTHLN